jgi:hypothetical protein
MNKGSRQGVQEQMRINRKRAEKKILKPRFRKVKRGYPPKTKESKVNRSES